MVGAGHKALPRQKPVVIQLNCPRAERLGASKSLVSSLSQPCD